MIMYVFSGDAGKTEDDMADRAAAAVLSGLGSEGDEGDDTRLQCEEALPADEGVAARTDATAGGSPSMPSPQAKPQHLGWKVRSCASN